MNRPLLRASFIGLGALLVASSGFAQAAPPPPPMPPPANTAPPPPMPPPANTAPPPPMPSPMPPPQAAPPPAPQQVAPSPAPGPQSAPPQPAQPALGPSDESLPWHLPANPKVYTPPQAPPPPPPPEQPPVKMTVTAYTQFYNFVSGDIEGSTAEIGARLGFAKGNFSFGVGLLPKDGLPTFSLDMLRAYGIPVANAGPVNISILTPSLQVKAATNFGDDVFFLAGASITGVRIAGCKGIPIPWVVDIRIPYFHGWVPLMVDGADAEEAGAEPATSWGFGVEAGIITF